MDVKSIFSRPFDILYDSDGKLIEDKLGRLKIFYDYLLICS